MKIHSPVQTFKEKADLVGQSIRAGCVAAPVSWIACTLAPGILASPTWNPVVGIVTSFIAYIGTFYWFSKTLTFRQCIAILGTKEVFENCIRYAVHFAVMRAGYPGSMASPIGQFVAGGLGHLSVPYLLRKRD